VPSERDVSVMSVAPFRAFINCGESEIRLALGLCPQNSSSCLYFDSEKGPGLHNGTASVPRLGLAPEDLSKSMKRSHGWKPAGSALSR